MRPQVPIDRSKGRQNGGRSANVQWPPAVMRKSDKGQGAMQTKERPKTLSSILANNQGVLNQIADFEEFANNIDRFESVSMSSSADMARAQARHTPLSGATDNVDFSSFPVQVQESRQPRPIRRHPQPTNSRDSRDTVPPHPVPAPQARARPVPRSQSPAPTPPPPASTPRAVQYWEQQQEVEMNRRRSAFAQLDIQEMRSLPDNSLADDALFSPASVSGHEQTTFQCHDVSNRGPKRSHSKKKEEKQQPPPDDKSFSIQTNSILSLLSTNNFLRTCTPSIPTDGDTPTTKKKSIWSYLDLNDDLYDYDDTKSPDVTDSSEDEDDDSDKQAAQTYRRRRRKKSPSPMPSPKSQRGDALRQAYEDLMFISKSPAQSPRHSDKTNNRNADNKHRSTTPNTIGSRSSYTHTTSGTTQDPESGDPSPTLSQIREDLWGNVPARPNRTKPMRSTNGTPILSNYSDQAHKGMAASTEFSHNNNVNSTHDLSFAPSTSGRNDKGSAYSSQHQIQHPKIPPLHPNKNLFDPFGLQGSTSHPQSRMFHHEGQGMHTDTTPRASNHVVSGNHIQESQQFENNEENTTRRHSFAISKRDTQPRRTRPHSFGGSRQQTTIREGQNHQVTPISKSTNGGNDDAFFPFAPDFYMFEALKKEISNGFKMQGAPSEFASDEDLLTINLEGRVESQLSNLSDSEMSAMMNEKIKQEQRMELVKQRSMRNFEMLKHLEEQKHPTKNRPPSTPAHNSNQKASSKRKPICDEVVGIPENVGIIDGPHMYVAYSRFGDHARDVLQLCEHRTVPKANTRQGQLLVKILASAISTTDCDVRRGEWSSVRLNPYIVPGVAFVGVVQDCIEQKKRPSAFSNFKAGDQVLTLTKQGGNSRYTVAPKDQLVKIPQHLDPSVAVCLAETYLTAFQGLHVGQRSNVRYRTDAFKGKSILILGCSSCLGRALIEVANAGGADYCYALVKERQFQFVQDIGGIPLPKDPQQWLTLIGRQIDVLVTVTDSSGLYSDRLTPDHLKAINENGHVVFIGPPGMNYRTPDVFSSTGAVSPSPNKLICKSIKNGVMDRSFAYNVFDSWDSDPKLGKKDLEHLIGLLEHGRLQPNVLERVPLSKVAKVHSILESKKIPGFIVCCPWMAEPHIRPRQHQPYEQQQLQHQQHHHQQLLQQQQHYDV